MKRDLLRCSAARVLSLRADSGPNGLADLKKLIDKIGNSVKALQESNDERLKEIEKTGAAYPETVEKVERINDAIDTMKTEMENAVKAMQSRADEMELALNRRGLGGSASDEQAHRAAAARFFNTVNPKAKRRKRATDRDLDLEAYDAYCDAFEDLVRANGIRDNLPADIRNALSVGSDPDGGFFVPAEMSTEIERRIHDTSPMRSLARVITIGTGAWEAPIRDAKAISGGWVGEREQRPATGTPQGRKQRIEVHEQYAYPEATQEMLDDAAVDIADMLQEETSDEMARVENLGYVNGNGVLKPRGFLDYGAAATTAKDAARSWGVLQYVPSGAAGAFPSSPDNPNALIDTIAALHPNYRNGAVWTMNRTTEATVRKLKDADGRYLVGFGDLRDSAFGFNLLGFGIENFEDMPDIAADSLSIAFGNYRRGYYIIDRMGFRVLVDPYTNKPFVGFYITKRTGGDVRNFDAIKLVKFSAS